MITYYKKKLQFYLNYFGFYEKTSIFNNLAIKYFYTTR
ncbi:hypothetical protein VPH159E362A_0063 [Vibrio phage 159E36-2a]